jgi:hypothetical protein
LKRNSGQFGIAEVAVDEVRFHKLTSPQRAIGKVTVDKSAAFVSSIFNRLIGIIYIFYGFFVKGLLWH